jgi:sorting nexin-4
MPSSPLDEDGFHSIAWEDSPPKPFSPSPVHDSDGFEDVTAEVADDMTNPMANAIRSTEGQLSEWNGKWMHVQVRDPIKEHEGSKDMYVSYAVRTTVRSLDAEWATANRLDQPWDIPFEPNHRP